MDNKRKETRTKVNYEACYIGFANGSTPDRISPCEILNISKNGIRISSVVPASEDHVVVSFADQNKKHRIITGEVRYCQYQDYDSQSESNQFNIGIKFLDPENNTKEFITTLVKCASKAKIERSFCIEQSQLVSDRIKQEVKREKDPYLDVDFVEDILEKESFLVGDMMEEVTEKDLEVSRHASPEKNTYKTGSEQPANEPALKKEIKPGIYHQRKSASLKQTSRWKPLFKVFASILLILAVGYSILFFIPEEARSQIPVINKIPVELPSLDRVLNLIL